MWVKGRGRFGVRKTGPRSSTGRNGQLSMRLRTVVRRVWVSAGLLFTAWTVWSFQAHGVQAEVGQSDGLVTVSRSDGVWRFVPVDVPSGAGVVLLPGGLVSPRAYFPLARSLATKGHHLVVVELPFRTAPTAAMERDALERARRAMAETGSAVSWALAGHSRGAAIATRQIGRSGGAFAGLILIATTHPKVDLSSLSLPVLKIGGTEDCVAPRERAELTVDLLPAETRWEWITGANHAQFGWYGRQLKDCRATISRSRQQAETVRLIDDFVRSGWRSDGATR